MSSAQYALNLGLLVYILGSNLGTRRLTPRRLALPVVLVGVAAWILLRDLPTLGNDVRLELVGAAAGAVLGVVAGLLVRVRRQHTGVLVTRAGTAYGVLWLVVIGGRMAFAYGADHWFPVAIGRFSMTHRITGADAWSAAFVLMALTLVLVRVLVTAVSARAATPGRQAVAA